MYGIILVSYSKKITEGTKEMIEEMTGSSELVEHAYCKEFVSIIENGVEAVETIGKA